MHALTKILSLFLLALCVFPASAKTLTEKQARDAAARIDSLLAADLKTANIRANGRISDSTFLRRAYLGIIGRIPSEEEASAFLENASRDKRANLVDFLTASPGFDSHLFNWTADLLRVQTKQEQFGLGWHVWLRKSLSEDKPWDTIVNEMLSSTGHAAKDPAVGYYLRETTTKWPPAPHVLFWENKCNAPSATTTPSMIGRSSSISRWPLSVVASPTTVTTRRRPSAGWPWISSPPRKPPLTQKG